MTKEDYKEFYELKEALEDCYNMVEIYLKNYKGDQDYGVAFVILSELCNEAKRISGNLCTLSRDNNRMAPYIALVSIIKQKNWLLNRLKNDIINFLQLEIALNMISMLMSKVNLMNLQMNLKKEVEK